MKNRKTEENVIIAIDAMKEIMILFLGPFLTAYFIKKSQESIVDLSIYYIFAYILIGIGSFIVASIIKKKFRVGILNLGRVVGYTMLLLAGLTGNTIVLSVVMFLLTLSILTMGLNIAKIEKFEE